MSTFQPAMYYSRAGIPRAVYTQTDATALLARGFKRGEAIPATNLVVPAPARTIADADVPVTIARASDIPAALATLSLPILGQTDLTTNIVTAGTAVTVYSSTAFVASGKPVRVRLAAGFFSAAAAVSVTFDIFDWIAQKVIRSSGALAVAAGAVTPLPTLERLFAPAAGDYALQFRMKASGNVAVTMTASGTSPDENPIQLLVEPVVNA